jgi:Lipocalin-like domain
LGACEKNDSDPSRYDLLTASGWKVIDYGVDVNKNGAIESAESDKDACNNDDGAIFNKDGKFESTIGTIKCDPSETNTIGTWQLQQNDTKISLSESGLTEVFNIVELSSNRLVMNVTSGTDIYLFIFGK